MGTKDSTVRFRTTPRFASHLNESHDAQHDVSAGSKDRHQPSDVVIGVCTFNEASNIKPLVSRLRAAIPNATILIVDDDSPDGTASLIRDMMHSDSLLQLVVRKDERGLGTAILRAMKYAIDESVDFFLNLDADLSHSPERLADMLDVARRSPDIDVVVGSRYVEGGRIEGWPLRRLLISRFLCRFGTLCLRLPVRDCSGSMRCYRVASLQKLDLERLKSRGYSLLEELLVHLHRQGAKMTELPITFVERQEGQSKLTFGEAIRSSFQILRLAVSGMFR